MTNNIHNDILSQLYHEACGCRAITMSPLTGSGSNRLYYKISGDGPTLIGVIGESLPENEAFIYLSCHFSAKGINVPKVLAVSEDRSAYVQEYAGDRLLYELLTGCRQSGIWDDASKALIAKAMHSLARIQYLGADGLNWSKCYPIPAMDRRSVMWDLNYFKYCFLKPCGIEFSEPHLEDEFNYLADKLLHNNHTTFMYRDFQSRNVMVDDAGNVTLIDFQGGRRGPAAYDVASFLWQARAQYPEELRREMVEVYLDAVNEFAKVDRQEFMSQLHVCIIFRMLQVLGAYGFRGLYEQKQQFVDSIPAALATLSEYLHDDDYPTLRACIDLATERFCKPDDDFEGLTLTVTSFSFKKGLPTDPSGNGGGYVFDCRALPNPGRYEQYRHVTGRDREVIQFLEPLEEVKAFVEEANAMVESSVNVYLQRGFSSLMASFGCTGGQHRSVYCAEQLARCIKATFPQVRVKLIHREQNIFETL